MSGAQTVAVTGAAGFIGSHVVDALIARGDRVIAMDNLSMGSWDNLAQHQDNPLFRFEQLDVTDAAAFRAACKDARAMIHLAAFKIPRYGKTLDTLRINSVGAENALEICRELGAKLLLASTSEVYGRNPNVPFTETHDSVYGPSAVRRWAYAVSKLYEEHLCYAFREAYGLDFVILRFFGSYGPRQHLTWWGGPQSVFIQAVLDDSEIEIHGDGTQTRSFTYISDTVRGIISALDAPAAVGEVINLGNTEEITILELAHRIYRLAGEDHEPKLRLVPYADLGGGYQDVMRRVPDTSKAERLLKVRAEVSLDDGLLRTIEWQRSVQPVATSV
ncbi:MAG: NAD-dependent epimerase/dehydratase family protein [Chloroflexi bacterium]|nr:NAD-dependent epimerase/dehydratase family protein [Chloroflexota bacterium]